MIRIQEVCRRCEGEEFKFKAITVYCQKRVRQNFVKMEESKTTGTNTHEKTHQRRGEGPVGCHETEMREMALQKKKKKKIFLASTSRHRDVGGNYCRYAGRLRQSCRCQKSLNCSYTRAKTVSWEESSRNWRILWGDRNLPGGKGAAGKRRGMEEQQPVSINPPTPISLKRIGINSSLPLPGDPEIRSKGNAFRHRRPRWNRASGQAPAAAQAGRQPGPTRGSLGPPAVPPHTRIPVPTPHTHPSRCAAPGPAPPPSLTQPPPSPAMATPPSRPAGGRRSQCAGAVRAA